MASTLRLRQGQQVGSVGAQNVWVCLHVVGSTGFRESQQKLGTSVLAVFFTPRPPPKSPAPLAALSPHESHGSVLGGHDVLQGVRGGERHIRG